MKKYLLVVVATLLLAASAFAQIATPPLGGPTSKLYFSQDYARWTGQVITGNSATGSQTILVYSSGAYPGNTVAGVNPFSTAIPVQFYGEILTPSAVSCGQSRPAGFAAPAGGFLCNVTATFANLHGAGEILFSGDAGIEEAVTDAGNQGGGLVYWVADTGTVTLNTGGLTTTSTTLVPTTFYNLGASAIVKTTITTSTNWAVGISGATAIFCAVNTALTAGTTCLTKQVAPATTGTTQALTAVLFTVTGANAGAGAVKARVWGFTPVQSAN